MKYKFIDHHFLANVYHNLIYKLSKRCSNSLTFCIYYFGCKLLEYIILQCVLSNSKASKKQNSVFSILYTYK